MPALASTPPNKERVAAALAAKKPVLDAALNNALSSALGGIAAKSDLALDSAGAQKLQKKISEVVGEMPALRGDKGDHAAPLRRQNIQQFGQPEPTDVAPNASPALPHDPGSAADILSDDHDAPDAAHTTPTDGGGGARPPARGGQGTPTEGTAPAAPNTPAEESTDKAPAPADQGLQYCPRCGRILNSDGTCPSGDDEPYARPKDGQDKPEQNQGAPTTPPAGGPSPGRTTPPPEQANGPAGDGRQPNVSPQQQKNKRELEWVEGNLKRDRQNLPKEEKKAKEYKKKEQAWKIIAEGAAVSVVFALFIPLAEVAICMAWWYRHKKKKAEAKVKKLEADIKANEEKAQKLKKKV